MKVLLVTHIYPPAVDGGSRVIHQLGQYFQKHGHRLLILTSNCYSTDDFVNPKSQPVSNGGLPVYKHLRRPLKLLNLIFHLDFLEVFQKGPIFKIMPFLKSLTQIIKFCPDLIIAGPLPTTIIIYASLIKKLTNSKLLINASFHPTDQSFFKKPLISALQSADYIWTLTDHETSFLNSKFQILNSKLINVGNGIDSSFLVNRPTNFPRNPNLLYVGAFAQHKNIEKLIDIFLKLSPKYPHLTLTLAGQKTLYLPKIEDKINSLPPKIQSRINLVLNFPDSRLGKLYDSCTILCQPSSQESFGLTLIEAWARKKPVSVSPIPQFFEIIKKSGGGVFLNQLENLIKSPPLCQKMGNNGFNFVKDHHTWDKIGDRLCQKIGFS